jgi:hypothetical protein
MQQTREEMTQNLSERLCWEVARRDDARTTSKWSMACTGWTNGRCWTSFSISCESLG